MRDGVEHFVSLGNPRFTETTDWRVRFTGKAQGAGITLGSEGWVEQDGLVYIDLTYGPSGNARSRLTPCGWRSPLRRGRRRPALHRSWQQLLEPHDMLLPKDAPGSLWSTLDTGINGSGMTVDRLIRPCGLAANAAAFSGGPTTTAVDSGQRRPGPRGRRRDEGVVLINHIVAQPTPSALTTRWR